MISGDEDFYKIDKSENLHNFNELAKEVEGKRENDESRCRKKLFGSERDMKKDCKIDVIKITSRHSSRWRTFISY
jgi:hypothetical protein